MALAAQLQSLRAHLKTDSAPSKRPFTRPSILFNPKEAADIGIETILSNALSGLEVLIGIDDRFRSYRNDLFSHKSIELDRELMGIDENNRINVTMCSYLRLLSGHLQLPSAVKTLEYLIRKYKIHVYNAEELILCSLPYHDTHVFVRIVQLLDMGNSRWKFLEGVKLSGAPPPRKVIVQQCIRDMGVLEVISSYALPSKKYQPSKPVISLCTAVIIEALGSVQSVENDAAKRVIPFVLYGLKSGAKGGPDHKAGALMIIALLASKVALSPELVKNVIISIAEVAREEAKNSTDLRWLRNSVLALVNLIQSQSVDAFPKKALVMLMEISDLHGVLMGLMKEFNVEKFLGILVDSLVDYSFSGDWSHNGLMQIIETVPLRNFIDRIVFKLLRSCVRLSQKLGDSKSSMSGSWAKKILVVINKNYPSELQSAVRKFMEDNRVLSKEGSAVEVLCRMLDGNLEELSEISDSKIWLALEHPKAEVRRVTLSNLDAYGSLRDKVADSQRLVSIRDAVLRRLRDEDLTVVQAALSLKCLAETLNPQQLFEALRDVLQRCSHLLISGMPHDTTIAGDVGIFCLELAASSFKGQSEFTEELATMLFPLLLILPRSQRLNLTALKLSKEVSWPLFSKLRSTSSEEKKLEPQCLSLINANTICCLETSFSAFPEEYVPWIIDRCSNEQSKTLFFLILLQSRIFHKCDFNQFFALLEVSLPILKSSWEALETAGDLVSAKELNPKLLDWDCKLHLDRLLDNSVKELNANILVSLFWKLLEALVLRKPADVLSDLGKKWSCSIDDLFVFFSTSQSKDIFENHMNYLLLKSKISPVSFLCKFFAEEGVSAAVQVESLHRFAYLCCQAGETLHFELCTEFPSLFVPLCSDKQEVRTVSIKCVEALFTLWPNAKASPSKVLGNQAIWSHFLGDLLGSVVQQKKLILSDKNFLPSFLTSLLSSSNHSLLVPQNIEQRFDRSTKEDMLHYILGSAIKLSAYGKRVILSLLKGIGCAIMHVEDVKSLLSELMERRHNHTFDFKKLSQKLSATDVEILCLLLEICATPSTLYNELVFEDYMLGALQLDCMSSEDPALILPCVTVLQKLSRHLYSGLKPAIQGNMFRELVFLFRNANATIQDAAREALLRINVTCSAIKGSLEVILEQGSFLVPLSPGKKNKKQLKQNSAGLHYGLTFKGDNALPFLSSLLDILLLKKDIENRASLLNPLFELLGKFFWEEHLGGITGPDQKWEKDSDGISQTISSTRCYMQQTLLLILKDIIASITVRGPLKNDIVNDIDVELLVKCARSAKDAVTRNHVYSLLSTIARASPNKILDHTTNILEIIGESAVTQFDRHSQCIFEDLISALVPCWLSKTGNIDKLLQIFFEYLPDVAENRRLSIVLYLIRTLGACTSLGSLLVLLFRSLVSRNMSSCSEDTMDSDFVMSSAQKGWEFSFAKEVCDHYTCLIWLPSLVDVLQQFGKGEPNQAQFMELAFIMHFILQKLQDPELSFKLEAGEDSSNLQKILGDLVEQVVSHLQVVSSKRKHFNVPRIIKRELNECMQTVLRTITNAMSPSVYCKCIVKLVAHKNKSVKKKALGFLCETIRDHGTVRQKHGIKASSHDTWTSLVHLDEDAMDSFNNMCTEIVKLVDEDIDISNSSLKLVAVSALEALATRFPNNSSVFNLCLASVTRSIDSPSMAISSGCLRTAGALINVLGPRALSELPHIMENVFKCSRKRFSSLVKKAKHNEENILLIPKESYLLAVLFTLGAVLDKLGGFLNPYLRDIVKLLVLNPDYVSVSDLKLKSKADILRRLVTEKIPVRLVLPPLLNIYPDAVKQGDSSLSAAFEMLSNLVSAMDKLSVSDHHTKIFDLCLQALDLRRQHPISIANIDVVEARVINTMIALTMKLTESLFRPLFIKSIEWAEFYDKASDCAGKMKVDRALSFYGFVNELVENHRSLFVPYFKYLLKDCVSHLTDADDVKVESLVRKRKKPKLEEAITFPNDGKQVISLGKWHLRALILSSLHKCFLFDTGSQKFLDFTNFQVLLKPLVSQLATDPPVSLDEHSERPSVKEVDDLLVSCIGQMAITSGNDLLWKSLNHEVLMQSRSENVRTQVLSLRIVKYLVENLKEEYLVFLAETIPFLAELLENAELAVKSLAQECLREMESMSGESLRQYL